MIVVVVVIAWAGVLTVRNGRHRKVMIRYRYHKYCDPKIEAKIARNAVLMGYFEVLIVAPAVAAACWSSSSLFVFPSQF